MLVAIGVNEAGHWEVIGAAEEMNEDKASWLSFLQCLNGRSLDRVRLIVGDKCLGMLNAIGRSSRKPSTSALQFISTAMYSRSPLAAR